MVGAVVLVAAATVADLKVQSDPAAASVAPAPPRLGHAEVVDTNDVGDPFVIRIPAPAGSKGPLYLRASTTDWESNIPSAVSTDLVHWSQTPDLLPFLPYWGARTVSMTWAPAIMRAGRSWVLYYSTEERSSGLECIGRATSGDATGPYYDISPSPMICQRSLGGSIDPSVVDAGGGRHSLVWKNDGNSSGALDSIWTQPLRADGLVVTGARTQLLSVDRAWQAGVVEAPAMVSAPSGGWWLYYSGGAWRSESYATGLAYCARLDQACKETSAAPLLASRPGQMSPGGLDTFSDGKGRLWAAFTTLVAMPSTLHPGHVYYNRVLDVAPFVTR